MISCELCGEKQRLVPVKQEHPWARRVRRYERSDSPEAIRHERTVASASPPPQTSPARALVLDFTGEQVEGAEVLENGTRVYREGVST